jgi:hypothetical protein
MKTWREIDGWFDYLCQVAGLGVEAQAFQATLIAQRALKPNEKLSDRASNTNNERTET